MMGIPNNGESNGTDPGEMEAGLAQEFLGMIADILVLLMCYCIEYLE